jgi:hypothetical protein
LGFNVPGRHFLDEFFYPKLKEVGVLPLCPFAACSEYLDFSKLNDNMSVREFREFWYKFNKLVGLVNYETLMPHAKFMIALEEGHSLDDGLCAEISYFAVTHGPVIGIRSDFRLSENIAASINPAVEHFHTNGKFFSGQSAYEDAFKTIKELANQIREGD